MATKENYNIITINEKHYTIVERLREKSEVLSTPYSVENYIDKVLLGKISRDVLIQRTADQWDKNRSSKFIEAILHNRPIGTFAVASGRSDSKNYAVSSLVDGLQRTTALVKFKQNKFTINKDAKPISCILVDEEGNTIEEYYEIAGKRYSQLPDAIKTFFNEYSLNVYRYTNFTDEELDDIVFCMNNGKSPNAYQKIRFSLGSDNMRVLQPICDSTLWEEVQGCKAKNDSILCCVIRTLMMLTFYNYNNLGSATMLKFADSFNDFVKMNTITKLSVLINELAEIKAKMTDEELLKLDSVTIPHYIVSLNAFKMKDLNSSDYIYFLRDFWNSENYNLFMLGCDSHGSGGLLYSAEKVEDRQCAIDDYMDEYLDHKNIGERDYQI